MTFKPRLKAAPLAALQSITSEEHATLRLAGEKNKEYWNEQPDEEKAIFSRFKNEIKDYYRGEQGLRCCYCSFELRNDQSTFDAEHILDKSTHPHFMFEPNNLAAACRPCNRAKNDKPALADGLDEPHEVPTDRSAYRIVHPHLDPWTEHLEFDELNRIRPVTQKGAVTIEVCDIQSLNAARLAENFGRKSGAAERLLRAFFRYKRRSKKRECIDFLRALAVDHNLAAAQAIVGRLEREYWE